MEITAREKEGEGRKEQRCVQEELTYNLKTHGGE